MHDDAPSRQGPRRWAGGGRRGAGFVALQMSLMVAFHSLVGGAHSFPWAGILHRYVFYVAMEMSVYAAIVIVVLLFDARREASERAIASARLAQSLTTARLESL